MEEKKAQISSCDNKGYISIHSTIGFFEGNNFAVYVYPSFVTTACKINIGTATETRYHGGSYSGTCQQRWRLPRFM